MIYKSSREEIERYRQAEGINQSYLKHIGNVYYFNSLLKDRDEGKLYFEEKHHFTIGNGVDTMLTNEEDFKNQFYISNMKEKPSDKIMSILHQVVDEFNFDGVEDSIFLKDLRDHIIKACRDQGYQPKYGDDALMKAVCEQGNDYYIELINSIGKTILSIEEKSLIDTIVNNLRNNPNTGRFLKDDNEIDIVYQFPITFEINGVKCKGLLDEVYIDHSTKCIYPIDIKTMGDYTLNFKDNFIKRRYDFQGAFYFQGIEKNLTQLATLVGKHLIGYNIMPFRFIVESTVAPGSPAIFIMGANSYKTGTIGVETPFRSLMGFEQAIMEYKWYLENGFTKQRILVEQNDTIYLD